MENSSTGVMSQRFSQPPSRLRRGIGPRTASCRRLTIRAAIRHGIRRIRSSMRRSIRPAIGPAIWFAPLLLAGALSAGCAGVGVDVPLLTRARNTQASGTADDQLSPASRAAARAALASSLPDRLTALQIAFLSNDAARLARFFPQQGPVYVSVPPLQEGGFLSPGPLKAFLDRLVRERVSVRFELPAPTPTASSDRDAASAFVKVKWTHRPAASATLQVDYLHLALRYTAEDAEWQIVEIKTSIR